jgi:hypothetical protein
MERYTNQTLPPASYVRQQQKARVEQQLTQAIGRPQDILMEATTIFPFTLFPDTVTVDRTKFTVAHRTFFKVAEVMSVNVKDILNVTANTGPFFGSLRITTRFFEHEQAKPYEVNWLWREDAIKLKRILQGCVIAGQQHIDISVLSKDELVHLLNRLGTASIDM